VPSKQVAAAAAAVMMIVTSKMIIISQQVAPQLSCPTPTRAVAACAVPIKPFPIAIREQHRRTPNFLASPAAGSSRRYYENATNRQARVERWLNKEWGTAELLVDSLVSSGRSPQVKGGRDRERGF
jgi:hypothetical protein